MAPKPTLHPKRKRELAEVGIGPQGESQFSPQPRDKSLEKTVRSTNNHQPKKDDTIMESTATHASVHAAPSHEEPSPVRIGQLADKAAGQVDQLHQAMLETRRPATIAANVVIQAVATGLVMIGVTALTNWLFKPKALEVLAPAPGVRK